MSDDNHTHNFPDNIIDFEEWSKKIARHGGKEALHDLGLDDPEFRRALKSLIVVSEDLAEVAKAWRALGWARKALIWIGTAAGAIAGIVHLFKADYFK